MDKYEYKIKLEEIKTLISEGEYEDAAKLADGIDWSRVKKAGTLSAIGDLYKKLRRFDDAVEMYQMAYECYPGGKNICYSLCELYVKTGDFIQAVECYKEFVQVAPRDCRRYILQYKIYEAQDVSLEERIEVLEELKKREYLERWWYELAYLYHRVGLATRCVEECDELILWYGTGKYVYKAMELKALHEPLSPLQQDKYDRRFETHYGELDVTPQSEVEGASEEEVLAEEASQAAEDFERQTQELPVSDVIDYEQEELTEEDFDNSSISATGVIRRITGALPKLKSSKQEEEPEQEDTDSYFMEEGLEDDISVMQDMYSSIQEGPVTGDTVELSSIRRAIDRKEAEALALGHTRVFHGVMADAELDEIQVKPVDVGEYNTMNLQKALAEGVQEVLQNGGAIDPSILQEPTGKILDRKAGRVIYESDTENLEDANIEDVSIDDLRPETESTRAAAEETEVFFGETGEMKELVLSEDGEVEVVSDDVRKAALVAQPPEPMAEVLTQEADGQIGFVIPENPQIDKQITGQISLSDVMAEWERMKRETEEKNREQLYQQVKEQTGKLFNEFETSVLNSVYEQLERESAQSKYRTVEKNDDLDFDEDIEQESGSVVTDGKPLFDAEEDFGEVEELTEIEESTEDELDAILNSVMAEAAESDMEEEAVEEASEPETEEESLEAEETEEISQGEAAEESAADEAETSDAQGDIDFSDDSQAEEPEESDAETFEAAEGEIDFGSEEGMEAEVEEASEYDEFESYEEEEDSEESEEEITFSTEDAQEEVYEEVQEEFVYNPVHSNRSLTEEEKHLFGPFIQSKSARVQLVDVLENVSLASYAGNVVLTGDEGVDTSDLASNIMRAVNTGDSDFNGKVGMIPGGKLTQKNIESTLAKMSGGAVIIEKAGSMSDEAVAALYRGLDKENFGIIITLTDTKRSLDKLFKKHPELNPLFTARMHVEALSNDRLVAFGKQYAKSMEFGIDAMGELALHTMIENHQSINHAVNVIEVKEMVDEAIAHAKRKTPRHFFDILFGKRYDEDDMIILGERDFK